MISCNGLMAQTQINEVNPTGKVGIGTLTPSESLEVQGKTMLHGELEVTDPATYKDDVTVQKKLKVDQDVKILGESVFEGDAKAKSDLKILGETKMKGDAFVDGSFKFKGLADPLSVDDKYLKINSNGLVGAAEAKDFLFDLYEPQPCLTNDLGNQVAIWSSSSGTPSYGILYTGRPCGARVGINHSNPNAELHLVGNADLMGVVGIGIPHNTGAQLDIKAVGNSGLCVRHDHSSDYSYAIKSVINRDNTKALAVSDSRNGADVFLVYGDGRIQTVINTDNTKALSVKDSRDGADVFRVYGDARKTLAFMLLQCLFNSGIFL